jgi:hypothetical protein
MRTRPTRPYLAPPFAPHQARTGAVTLPVPGFRQVRSYSCGFASTLMIARYFGVATPGADVYRRLGTDGTGTRQTAIVKVLRQLGLRAGVRYDVDFERIARGIDDGKPIIGYLVDVEHWLVIYGYGRAPERIFVADPRPLEQCEQLWAPYGARLGGFGIFCSGLEPRERPQPPPPPAPPPGQLAFDFDGAG